MRFRGISLIAALAIVTGCANVEAVIPRAAAGTARIADTPKTDGADAGEAWDRAERRRLDRVLGRYLRGRPGRAEVAVYDRTTRARYAYRQRGTFMLASVAKVDILLTLLLQAQHEHRRLSGYERRLASRMIRYSDNDCAHELYLRIGGQSGLTRQLRRLGVRDTYPGPGMYWGATRSHPDDQVKVLDRLTSAGGPVSKQNRRYALDLMSSVSRDQAWGVSAAAGSGDVALKNGWLPARVHDGLWTINSIGRLVVDDHELLVAVLSERSPTMEAGVGTVEQVARLAVHAMTRDEDR